MEGCSERLSLGSSVVSRLFWGFFFLTLFSQQILSPSHGLELLQMRASQLGQFYCPGDIWLCLDMVLVSRLGGGEENVLLASSGAEMSPQQACRPPVATVPGLRHTPPVVGAGGQILEVYVTAA